MHKRVAVRNSDNGANSFSDSTVARPDSTAVDVIKVQIKLTRNMVMWR
jgi:hypothetical protein